MTGVRRKAGIIKDGSSEKFDSPFYCAICDGSKSGRLAVSLMGRRICWPCARAIYRRLSREVTNATSLADSLRRVGRQRVRVPREAPDIEADQLAEGRLRAQESP